MMGGIACIAGCPGNVPDPNAIASGCIVRIDDAQFVCVTDDLGSSGDELISVCETSDFLGSEVVGMTSFEACAEAGYPVPCAGLVRAPQGGDNSTYQFAAESEEACDANNDRQITPIQ